MMDNKLIEQFRIIENKKGSTKDHLTENIMFNFSV